MLGAPFQTHALQIQAAGTRNLDPSTGWAWQSPCAMGAGAPDGQAVNSATLNICAKPRLCATGNKGTFWILYICIYIYIHIIYIYILYILYIYIHIIYIIHIRCMYMIIHIRYMYLIIHVYNCIYNIYSSILYSFMLHVMFLLYCVYPCWSDLGKLKVSLVEGLIPGGRSRLWPTLRPGCIPITHTEYSEYEVLRVRWMNFRPFFWSKLIHPTQMTYLVLGNFAQVSYVQKRAPLGPTSRRPAGCQLMVSNHHTS